MVASCLIVNRMARYLLVLYLETLHLITTNIAPMKLFMKTNCSWLGIGHLFSKKQPSLLIRGRQSRPT